MTRRLMLLLASAAALAGSGAVLAHHSFGATYDTDAAPIEIEGVVRELVWRNPHSFVRVDVTADDGTVETWVLEWASINQLSEAQLTRTTLLPGQVVVANGTPPRDPGYPRLLLHEISRPSDGWKWQGRIR
ncbi:MAG TPA: DUF6152 family protein [Gammaproteobacteria bacterium]